MKTTNYHIDVTPEEDALFRDIKQPTSKKYFGRTFFVVAFIHVALAVGITAYASNESPTKTDQSIPAKQPEAVTEAPNDSKPVQQPLPQPNQHEQAKPVSSNKLTSTYVVKNGDTIYSISKKYKLNVNLLLKLNHIKDPNKIVAGQTLKFM